MSGREAILSRMRTALRAGADDAARARAVQQRLESAPRGVIPARGQIPEEDRVRLFCAMAEKVSATVERVARPADVPQAVARYLREKNLPARVRMGSDERLRQVPWGSEPSLEITVGRAEDSDLAGLAHALGGIAETGTLVLASGPANPTTVNFLPEHHLVVVRAKDIAGDMETVFDRVRETYGKGVMPRTLNFITGPSRSADIEQTLLLGAHGPRALHVIVVDGD